MDDTNTTFDGIDIDSAHNQVAGPDKAIVVAGMPTTEPDDAAAVQHFRDIVQELLTTRTFDEIRRMLEEEFAVGLGQWRVA